MVNAGNSLNVSTLLSNTQGWVNLIELPYSFLIWQQSHQGNIDGSPHPPQNPLPFEETKSADGSHCIEKNGRAHKRRSFIGIVEGVILRE